MRSKRYLRVKTAALALYGGTLFAGGGCLPENYFGDLFVRLSTGAADVAIGTLVRTALDVVLPTTSDATTDVPAG